MFFKKIFKRFLSFLKVFFNILFLRFLRFFLKEFLKDRFSFFKDFFEIIKRIFPQQGLQPKGSLLIAGKPVG